MRKYSLFRLFLFFCFLLLSACNTTTPEEYFDIAVLNINMLHRFANEGLSRELKSPSVKMSENNKEPVPMKRSEVINMKIQFIEENFNRLEKLKETDDSKDIIQASLALYKFVLPVYKSEYTQLADLYDSGAQPGQIESLSGSIHDKYFRGFDELYKNLMSAGKIYAAKHDIKVKWETY